MPLPGPDVKWRGIWLKLQTAVRWSVGSVEEELDSCGGIVYKGSKTSFPETDIYIRPSN